MNTIAIRRPLAAVPARRTRVALALSAGAALLVGCAGAEPRARLVSDLRPPTAVETTPLDPAAVEVWTDGRPAGDVLVVGTLEVRTLDSARSIESMRERAALEGLHGIFDIECRCSGVCTAKGYVDAGRSRPHGAVRASATVASR